MSHIDFDQEAIEKDLNSPLMVLCDGTEQDMTVERMLELLHNMGNSKPLEPKFAKVLDDNILDLF